MYVEARALIRTRSVCDQTISSWGFGGAVSPPAGSGARNFFSTLVPGSSGQRPFSTN